jgi:hypothetical protein
VPRTAPFGAWLVAFVAGALRALCAPAGAEPERRCGLSPATIAFVAAMLVSMGVYDRLFESAPRA